MSGRTRGHPHVLRSGTLHRSPEQWCRSRKEAARRQRLPVMSASYRCDDNPRPHIGGDLELVRQICRPSNHRAETMGAAWPADIGTAERSQSGAREDVEMTDDISREHEGRECERMR